MTKTYTNKEMALIYNKKYNWNVFPVNENKQPFFSWARFQKDKVTPEMIEKWWDNNPDANIACATGAISNVAVLDLDCYKDNLEINGLNCTALQRALKIIPTKEDKIRGKRNFI